MSSRAERRATTAARLPPQAAADFLRLQDRADVLINVGRSRNRKRPGAGDGHLAAGKRLRRTAKAIARSVGRGLA